MYALDLPHLRWIADNCSDGLRAALEVQGVDLDVLRALCILADADPDPRKRAVQWLADSLVSGNLAWEDVAEGACSRAHQTLTWFTARRSGMPRAQARLETYATLDDVHRAVVPFLERLDDTSGGRARRRAEQARALAESVMVCERDDLTVAVPLTRSAACWWGRGTRWCTSAFCNNAFDEHDSRGPLVVLVLNGAKYQVHAVRRGQVVFRDAADRLVTSGFLEENWTRLAGFLEWLVLRNGTALIHVPRPHRTPTLCLYAMRTKGDMLSIVSRRSRTRAVIWAAVGSCGPAIRYHDIGRTTFLPAPWRSFARRLCLRAVQQNGLALGYLSYEMRSHAVCMAAVRQNGMAVRHVPRRRRTPEILLAAVQCNGLCLEEIRVGLDSGLDASTVRSIDMAAVASRGDCLIHVPMHLRDRKMCLTAVRSYGSMLCHVPFHLRDAEMCHAAMVATHPSDVDGVLDHVPEDAFDDELWHMALSKWPGVIRRMPHILLDEETCRYAVVCDTSVLSHVPPHLRTLAVCMAPLSNTGFRPRDTALEIYAGEVPSAIREVVMQAMRAVADETPGILPQRSWNPVEELAGLSDACRLPEPPKGSVSGICHWLLCLLLPRIPSR